MFCCNVPNRILSQKLLNRAAESGAPIFAGNHWAPYRHCSPLIVGIVLTFLCLIIQSHPLNAQTFFWSVSNGSFQSASSWSAGGPPGVNNAAEFGLPGNFQATFNSDSTIRSLIIRQGTVNFNMNGHTLTTTLGQAIGNTSGQNTTWNVTNGNYFMNNTGSIGDADNTTTVNLNNASYRSSGFTNLGNLSGSIVNVNVTNNSHWMTGDNSNIGNTAGSVATVTVDGAGSSAVFGNGLGIGNFGSGTIHVNNQALLSTLGTVTIGNSAGSSGLVQISGDGSTWNQANGQLSIGSNSGSGAIHVDNKALLSTSGSVAIGDSTGSSGLVQISGDDSNWNHSNGQISIGGNNGTGEINVLGGTMNVSGINSDIRVNSGGIFDVSGSNVNVFGGGSGNSINVFNGGNMTVQGGSNVRITNTDTDSGLRILSGGLLVLNTGSISTSNFVRQGNFSFLGGEFAVDGGVFDNQNSAFSLSGVTGDPLFTLQNGATTSGVTSVSVGLGGKFNVLSGSTLTTNASSVIGTQGFGNLMRVNGADSTWNSSGFVSVGDATGTLIVENGGHLLTNGSALTTGISGANSNGTVLIQSGGRIDAGLIELSRVAGSVSNATFTGTGSEINSTGLFVGGSSGSNGGTAALTIADGAEVNVNGTTRIRTAGTLNLNDGTLTTTNFSRDTTGVLNFGGGTMNVLGIYSNGSGTVTLAGSGANDNPTLVLEGNSSTSGITALNVGSTLRQGTLTLNPGSLLNTGAATIASRGTVNLNGGNLQVTSIANNGTFNWNSGAVRFTTSSTLDATTLTGLLGSAHILRDNQTLASFGTLTIGSTLNVNGGTLQGFNLTNNSTLAINSGNFNATQTLTNNAGRTIQINGVSDLLATTGINNSGTIRLNSATASISGGSFDNNAGATLSGTGQINNDLDNSGTIRVTGAEHLVFAGASNRNVMNMNLSGGTLEFTDSLINRNGAAIAGRGTFIGSSANPGGLGLTNDGLMSFSAGTTDVFGDVDQTSRGQIVTSGGGTTTFFDDVKHNGVEIRTFLGSRTVFLGDQSGAGNFTGTGVVEYAGDLRPGNSPASVSYEGDVFMNSSVNSFFELGGLASGAFDQLRIAGDLNLDGNLLVSLINGFSLAANEQFLIGDIGGNLTGHFNGLNEGSLVGNFGGQNLFITYAAGNGNDIGLFTTAIPEPGSGLILVGLITGLSFYRRRRGPIGCNR